MSAGGSGFCTRRVWGVVVFRHAPFLGVHAFVEAECDVIADVDVDDLCVGQSWNRREFLENRIGGRCGFFGLAASAILRSRLEAGEWKD